MLYHKISMNLDKTFYLFPLNIFFISMHYVRKKNLQHMVQCVAFYLDSK